MKKHGFLSWITIACTLIASEVNASSPVWTFTPDPAYPPKASVQFNTLATIKYKITNQSQKPHTLSANLPQGVRQITYGAGNCGSKFTLGYQESCNLILKVIGSKIQNSFSGGPRTCDSNFLCYQPDEKDIINITKVNVEDGALTIAPQSLTLTATSGTSGIITVTNPSDVTITHIAATLPNSWTDVTQDSNQCTSLLPHTSCQLSFTPGATSYSTALIPIQSTNAAVTIVSMQVIQPSTAPINADALTLSFVQNGTGSQINITNTSSSITATNIVASLPVACTGIQQDATNCTSLAPGNSCHITITPGSAICSDQSFTIQGDNTSQLSGIVTTYSSTATISSSPASLILEGGTSTPSIVTVINESPLVTATNIRASIPSSLTSCVSQDASHCTSVAPGASCEISFTPIGITACGPNSATISGTNTTSSTVTLSVEAPPATTLLSSTNNLALSVKNTTLNSALTGNARTITISNTGNQTAHNVSYTASPSLPSGTTITPSTCGTIAAGDSCILTVTPGATPSAAVGNKTPTPITLTIQSSNTNTLLVTLNILTYGSVYQSGYLFSVDDATESTLSIGGKVLNLSPQASSYPSGIYWSSNSNGTLNTENIPGIYETSTASDTSCDGSIDGACNSKVILNYYSNIPTQLFPAGLCSASINGYSDWYLPALCELGYSRGDATTVCGTQTSPVIQNVQSNLVENGNIANLQGFYTWSSTEYSSDPTNYAWSYFLGNYLSNSGKSVPLGVYCARALT